MTTAPLRIICHNEYTYNLVLGLVTETSGWRSSVSSAFSRSDSDNVSMNSARNTVFDLDVKLWDGIRFVDGSSSHIRLCSSFNHVSNQVTLDGLVLWDATVAVDATNWLDVTSTLLVTAVISTLLSLYIIKYMSIRLKIDYIIIKRMDGWDGNLTIFDDSLKNVCCE